jgi:hypothetical protein
MSTITEFKYRNIIPDNIPFRLKDNNLSGTKNNPVLIYIFCILIRIILGWFVYYNQIPNYIIFILSVFVILVFSFKFIKFNRNWKNYIRCIITYTLVILFTEFNDTNKNNTIDNTIDKNINKCYNAGGLLIIIDALMGQQSRFIQSNMF